MLPAVLLLLCALSAHAQDDAGAARERELKDLRTRIEALSSSLQEKEASRREAGDVLRASEKAISETNRRLRALEEESRRLRIGLRELDAREARLDASLQGRHGILGVILSAHYAGAAPDVLRVLLSGQDPLDAARRLAYLEFLSRETAREIAAVRVDLASLAKLRAERKEQADLLAENSKAERADRARIESERRTRRVVLDRIAGEIRRGRREIGALQADESRLARLVEELGRMLAARKAERPAQAETRTTGPGGPFSRLRGQLRLPVRGEILSRFGIQRGGSTGKGIFIRADEGQPVRAVAGGQVVFADWMRGFGNLLILDHGESYLSVYANNESLLKKPGDGVTGGETVATVGSSGGSERSGLYFELRHLGKAFDPVSWTR
jgi:septal ring factor EnvC (AmiA/AmiB activator)